MMLNFLAAFPCPFCGAPAEIEPWHGGGPRKRLVSCSNVQCPVHPQVAGSTEKRALASWNTRSKIACDEYARACAHEVGVHGQTS